MRHAERGAEVRLSRPAGDRHADGDIEVPPDRGRRRKDERSFAE
ncbi:hypothetical protein AB0K57_29630 [Streptomyces halstedii]